jgi:hypothetical protein
MAELDTLQAVDPGDDRAETLRRWIRASAEGASP